MPERDPAALVASQKAREEYAALRDMYGRDARLGCSLVAHRDLGLCAACVRTRDMYDEPAAVELTAWRLLAMAERGVPPQQGEHDV